MDKKKITAGIMAIVTGIILLYGVFINFKEGKCTAEEMFCIEQVGEGLQNIEEGSLILQEEYNEFTN